MKDFNNRDEKSYFWYWIAFVGVMIIATVLMGLAIIGIARISQEALANCQGLGYSQEYCKRALSN